MKPVDAIPGVLYPPDEFHLFFQVVCTCGADAFDVHASRLPRVIASCRSCARSIAVYDVRQYPAATPYPPGDELLSVMATAHGFSVYVMYEYPGRDEDEAFDPDDISWCQVYGKDVASGAVSCIIDDETA